MAVGLAASALTSSREGLHPPAAQLTGTMLLPPSETFDESRLHCLELARFVALGRTRWASRFGAESQRTHSGGPQTGLRSSEDARAAVSQEPAVPRGGARGPCRAGAPAPERSLSRLGLRGRVLGALREINWLSSLSLSPISSPGGLSLWSGAVSSSALAMSMRPRSSTRRSCRPEVGTGRVRGPGSHRPRAWLDARAASGPVGPAAGRGTHPLRP